ncbi:ArsR family transcriptional regulator [Opitutaceae bacterium EW11]|nr:ArsR family transcriptional regulator [Opitutaceae bacterium EW11]
MKAHPDTAKRQLLFQQFALIGHAVSSPARLAMISLLAHGEKTVDQLAGGTNQTLATASAHLKVLRAACLVTSDKRGRQVFCRLAGDNVAQFWLALRTLGEELLPEARDVARQFTDDRRALAPLSPSELAAELRNGRVTLLDLRPREEYATAHLPGARNLPAGEITAGHVAELPRKPCGRVYAYCRGPYCVMGLEGTRKLRALGLPVRRLKFSVPEWVAAGEQVVRKAG